MKIAGFLLLVAGWMLVLTALGLLHPGGVRSAFIAAGFGVEAMGLALAVHSHRTVSSRDRSRNK